MLIGAVLEALKQLLPPEVPVNHTQLPSLVLPSPKIELGSTSSLTLNTHDLAIHGQASVSEAEGSAIFWIGPEGMALTNILMAHSAAEVSTTCHFSPLLSDITWTGMVVRSVECHSSPRIKPDEQTVDEALRRYA